MSPLSALLPFLAGLPLATPVPATEKAPPHPFDAHDLVTLQRLSDPQISPDGHFVAYSLRSTDLDANKGTFDLWMVDVDGKTTRQLTTDPASDTSPRWSADGKSIFFLSSRSGTSQVWRLDLAGGEPHQVTRASADVNDLVVSPDGHTLVVTFDVYPECGDKTKVLVCTAARDEEKAKSKATGRIYEKLFVRHWDTWKDGKRRHPFAFRLDGGDPVDLMAGIDADSPSKPFGGGEELAFTHDARELVYTARVTGREEAWSTDFNLYRVPIDASKQATCLTCDNKAWDTSPVFSPDGSTLAWLAMSRPGFEADKRRIRLMDWATGKVRDLPDWDRSPESAIWHPDGKHLFALAENLGQLAVFELDAKTGKVSEIVKSGFNQSLQATRDRLVFSQDTFVAPADVMTVRFDGREPKQITHVNQEALSAIVFGEPEQFSFKGAKGDTVYGYLIKPASFDPKKKYPVAFLVHGGPQGSWENHFHYRWNPETYTGSGYAVVMVDFHGSTGYGQAFQDAIRDDWGGAPFEDLMKGLDAAIQKYSFLDGNRVGALGASFGGYMIYWIAGQTDRFKCLVAHDGNLDERMAYFDTEELWFPEWEHRGTPWTNPSGYTKQNPIDHVDAWKTPMLVVHSANDFRVVDTQGLSAFTALQRKGIPSKLLYFPDESHWVLKPANSLLWHETVTSWLDRWLKPGENAPAK
jgi:dipeptidyl aminopeptidase/acylaminoacyl peptidase